MKSVTGIFLREGFEVKTLNYFPSGKSDKAVIIVPPTGGTNFLNRRYATALCKKGFAVYIMSRLFHSDKVTSFFARAAQNKILSRK
jgi:predicted alpha/beta hydrolase